MTQSLRKFDRTRLMLGCGSAALAMAMSLTPQTVAAQGIQATPSVVTGSASVSSPSANTTRIDVSTQTAVINWTPQVDNSGNALAFLPTGSTANFRGNAANFAVLNRILPTTNNNIAVIDGSVISQFVNPAAGIATGGFIAFYSPTGILVGANARFDVGRLMLTTLDTTPANFTNFANGGTMSLQGQAGSRATITVSPGAQITATPANAFFAVIAADVDMRGTATVNGSHAYVAGEVVGLSFSNGLFNIFVSTGTAASGEVVTLNGNIGGPSSTGVGDNHMIYAAARAAADPISMLLSGNIGFAPAQSAGIVNGEIILAANYNVFGRNVAGGAIGQDINTVTFSRSNATTAIGGDITLQDFNASSSVLAIGNGRTRAASVNANSNVTGNLMLVGRQSAVLDSQGPRSFTVSGDVLVDSRDFGVVGSGLQSLDVINAAAGNASIIQTGSTINIGGNALVAADAIAGADNIARIAGTAVAGAATIISLGGTLTINGNATVSARGIGTSLLDIQTGATVRGGTALFNAQSGGSLNLGGNLNISADAVASQGSLFSPSSVSNAYGGNAQINTFGTGSSVTVGGDATITASAFGGDSNNAGAGSIGDAGIASVATPDAPGTIIIAGALALVANGIGGNNGAGRGGPAFGGRASAATFQGGRITVGGELTALGSASGGNGTSGGDAFGGIAGANAVTGIIELGGAVLADTSANGGSANFGNGGNGGIGRGGNAFFQADGTSSTAARLTIAGNASLNANGFGGGGGQSDGSAIVAGRGGDGFGGIFSTPNQADPNFGSGAFLLAGGDYGTLSVAGTSEVFAQGSGGQGGSARGLLVGGSGGNGFGGLAQAGLTLLGGPGTVGGGSATFSGDLRLNAPGVGGDGGFAVNSEDPGGPGGNGTGGAAFVTVRAGDVVAGLVQTRADGSGGDGGGGNAGGDGTGGTAGLIGSLDGSFTLAAFEAIARGLGGFAGRGTGGNGFGGTAAIEGDLIDGSINGNALLDASGIGGSPDDGAGGNGEGGEAYIEISGIGGLDIRGHGQIFANGVGGSTVTAFGGSNGSGGEAYIHSLNGSGTSLFSAQLAAIGSGGSALVHEGGDGFGGRVELLAEVSALLSILNGVPTAFTSSIAGAAVLNAEGRGANTNGGTGRGGEGRGGQINGLARNGGGILFPSDPLNNPGVGEVQITTRGIGGGSSVEGGTGGAGLGGSALIEADGSNSGIVLTDANFTVLAQGGSSLVSTRNITGGAAFGGRSTIRVLNGGEISLIRVGGNSGGEGGDGSGTGNGGSAQGGSNGVEINGGTLNFTGILALLDEATGGTGLRGGDAFASGEGGGVAFIANNATITPIFGGQNTTTGITLDAIATGGAGATGGNAETSAVIFNLLNTNINSLTPNLRVRSAATGGNATDPAGRGGNAISGPVSVRLTNAALDFGEMLFASDANGGDGGGVSGTGGNAQSGIVDVQMTGSSLTNSLSQSLLFEARSRASGGGGTIGGNGTSGQSTLRLANSAITGARNVTVSTAAFATRGGGGIAIAGDAGIDITGTGGVTASDGIAVLANAEAREDTKAGPGTVSFRIGSGSTAVVNAGFLELRANQQSQTSGTGPGNGFGQFAIDILGGSLNLQSLIAAVSGSGDVNRQTSRLVANGGNINVSNDVRVFSPLDIEVRTGSGSIIGNAVLTGNTAIFEVEAGGQIQITGDGSAGTGLFGQTFTIDAGNSILFGGNLTSRNGVVTLTSRPFGLPQTRGITMASGTRIDAGTGTVTVRAADGTITLANIAAGRIDVRNLGLLAGSDITVRAGSVLTASGTGRAIDLASLGGEVINLAGDAGLVLTGGGHYGIFAATPTGSQIGSFANYARRYNVANAAAYDTLNPGGNFAAFRITPVLTVTANAVSRFYGSANPVLTANFAGFQPGDSIANLSGALQFTTAANLTSNVGTFAINTALGSLLSQQGYQFTFNPGVLTITARPITVIANNFTRVYGNTNPALAFGIGGEGLVNGDQLTGALATTAGVLTGVGNVLITQGTLAASSNYALTFVDGQLSITPRPITVTASNLTRIYGNTNPALTFALGGQGLVNGDQLTGVLATIAGVSTGVGNVLITQGSLAASSNYALTFVNGQLTITPRPISVTADNLSKLLGERDPLFTFTLSGDGLVNGDQLLGSLVRDPGESIASFAIRQGTLSAGPNYAITFADGSLAINAPPFPPAITNATFIDLPFLADEGLASSEDEDEERYGVDFPDRPETPLISEDPLLDDPVTSGGDASVYGASTPPAGGGK